MLRSQSLPQHRLLNLFARGLPRGDFRVTVSGGNDNYDVELTRQFIELFRPWELTVAPIGFIVITHRQIEDAAAPSLVKIPDRFLNGSFDSLPIRKDRLGPVRDHRVLFAPQYFGATDPHLGLPIIQLQAF